MILYIIKRCVIRYCMYIENTNIMNNNNVIHLFQVKVIITNISFVNKTTFIIALVISHLIERINDN